MGIRTQYFIPKVWYLDRFGGEGSHCPGLCSSDRSNQWTDKNSSWNESNIQKRGQSVKRNRPQAIQVCSSQNQAPIDCLRISVGSTSFFALISANCSLVKEWVGTGGSKVWPLSFRTAGWTRPMRNSGPSIPGSRRESEKRGREGGHETSRGRQEHSYFPSHPDIGLKWFRNLKLVKEKLSQNCSLTIE